MPLCLKKNILQSCVEPFNFYTKIKEDKIKVR